MPNKPQPVPPIYQPEVAADAIVYAATHNRREIYVGFPTVESVVGNKVAPRLLDYYLGRNCYRSQQTDESDDPNRPNNLFDPPPGDYGAHGAFDRRARKFSLQLWLNKHRDFLAGAVLIPAAAIGCLFLLSNSKKGARL